MRSIRDGMPEVTRSQRPPRWALTVAWCVAIAFVGFRWAMKLYDRDVARS